MPKGQEKPLWSVARPEDVRLSKYGRIVVEAIEKISTIYPVITVDKMPNHIHLLLQIDSDSSGRAMLAPTISIVIQQMKGYATKKIGRSIWQKLFHDHVIRDEKGYLKIWNYIEGNPSKWEEDCFYMKEE